MRLPRGPPVRRGHDLVAAHGGTRAFVWGVLSTFRGLRFILRTRGALRLAVVPALVLLALSCAGIVFVFGRLTPAVLARLPEATSGIGSMALGLLRFLTSVVLGLVAVLVATWLTPPLSGPALERLILLRERELGVPERPPAPLLTEVLCGLRAQLVGLLVGGPLLVVLWVTTLVAPPLAILTVPLKLLTIALLVAWSLLDYPLSLRGIPLRSRLALLRGGAPVVVGFGASVALLFAVPFGAIVLLPAGVVGATEIAVALTRRAPS